MSIYRSGIDSYRDTTKWLAAFTPVTAVATSIVIAGAPLASSLASSPDAGQWWVEHWLVAVCGLAVLIGIGLILWRAAVVLSVRPMEALTGLKADGDGKRIADAFGAGIASPEFDDYAAFDRTATEVLIDLAPRDAAERAAEEAIDASVRQVDLDRLTLDLARVRTTYETVREWKLFDDIRKRFTVFLRATIGGVALISAAILVALTQLPGAAAVSEPAPVVVTVSAPGASALAARTGCNDPDASSFTAIGGTWEAPVLAVVGPGCTFSARWAPTPAEAQVLPQP